jgi:nucleoside-diphosphate-sugar epimerase
MISQESSILITGATGFIGANILRKLLNLQYQNINILIREESNIRRIKDIINSKWIHIYYGDMIDKKSIDNIIKNIKPDYIFHLATWGSRIGRDSITEEELILNNLLWTKNLLDTCVKIWFKAFINTWSSSEYWEKDTPMSETDMLEPNNMYGFTKACTSLYCTMIGKQQNLPIYNYKIFSAYWPYEDKERLISHIILSYIKWKQPNLASPSSVRDFIFIDDIIYYYLHCNSIHWRFGESFNIWSGKQESIENINRYIKNILDSTIDPIYNNISNQYEPKSRVANNNKLSKIFWKKETSLTEWLRLSVERYKKRINLYN